MTKRSVRASRDRFWDVGNITILDTGLPTKGLGKHPLKDAMADVFR